MSKSSTLQIVAPDTGLTEIELKFAQELAVKAPHIVKAHAAMHKASNALRGKWLTLVEACRKPIIQTTLLDGKEHKVNMTPNGRELTLLLRSLGEAKSRVSEIIKVASADEPTFALYREGILGFRAVLKVVRDAGLPAPDGTTEMDADNTEEEYEEAHPLGTGPKSKNALATFPPEMLEALSDVLTTFGFDLPVGLPDEPDFGMRFELTAGEFGIRKTRSFKLTLEMTEEDAK